MRGEGRGGEKRGGGGLCARLPALFARFPALPPDTPSQPSLGDPSHPLQVGNYGGAWYRQQKDFAEFPGPILVSRLAPANPHAGVCRCACRASAIAGPFSGLPRRR
jgi:hypothetical protein